MHEAMLELLTTDGVTFVGRNGRATCIDYIAISRDLQKSKLRIETLFDSTIGSDHIPLEVEFRYTIDKRNALN